MRTTAHTWNIKNILLTATFTLCLLSATALQVLIKPHAALAYSDTYPTSIAGCRYVNGGGSAGTCNLKDSTQDKYYDPWGEENRECVSYVAWMLHSVNGFEMPFFGNAADWKAKAQNLGYTVNTTPAVGSVYWLSNPSPWGHVAYVQSVSSDQTHVDITEYNADFTGHFSQELNVAASSAGGYIHFKDTNPNPPAAPLRIGVVDKSGTFQVKESDPGAQWTYEYSGVTQGVVSGTLIGELSGGIFQVKQGGLTAFWTNEWTPTGTPIAGALSDASGSAPLRIGVVTNDGHFYVKEGSLTAPWADQWPAGGVIAGYVSGTRIGILTNDGIFRVKDGGLDAQWTIEDYNVTQGILSGSLIGEIKSSGVYNVKQGGLDAQWTTEWAGGATTGTLSDATSNTALRIGFVDSSGVFRVKEGGLSTQWVTEATVSQGVVSGALVGALEGSSFYVKQGRLDANWTDEWDNTTAGSLWSL